MEERVRYRRSQRHQSQESFWSDSDAREDLTNNRRANAYAPGERVIAAPVAAALRPPPSHRSGGVPHFTESPYSSYAARIPRNPQNDYELPYASFDLAASSGFEGRLPGYIGRLFITTLLTIATLGLYGPWAFCAMRRWEADRTIISGRRVRFEGTGDGLFFKWIVWTFPIYLDAAAICAVTLFAPNAVPLVYAITLVFMIIYPQWVRLQARRWNAERTFLNR